MGLDTGDYSFAYVARWSDGDVGKMQETGERVIQCAKQIQEALEVPKQVSARV